MNYMNASREFQDVESICIGKVSHVPSQPTVVRSPRSMSRDQCLRPDTWNLSGTQGNVFGSPRAVSIHPDPLSRNSSLLESKCYRWVGGNPVRHSTGRLVAKGEEQIGSIIPMPRFARKPSTMNSFSPAEGPQNSMVDQQSFQISERQFDKFTTLSTFSCCKIRFKAQISACSRSPSEAILWIKEVEMVDSVDEKKEKLDARIASALSKIIQNSYFKKQASLEEEQKAQKEDQFLRGRHDLRLLSCHWRS